MRFLATLAFFVAFTAAVFAQTFSPQSINALKARIAVFETAAASMEINGLVDVMPPKIKNFLMTKYNVSEQQLKDSIDAVFKQTAETVTITSFKMDVDKAESKTLSDGLNVLIVPTETRMDIKDQGKILATSATVAFIENDMWYMLRVDAQQLPILYEVYPAFKEVTLPEEKMESIKD
jgi:hypothetical protein